MYGWFLTVQTLTWSFLGFKTTGWSLLFRTARKRVTVVTCLKQGGVAPPPPRRPRPFVLALHRPSRKKTREGEVSVKERLGSARCVCSCCGLDRDHHADQRVVSSSNCVEFSFIQTLLWQMAAPVQSYCAFTDKTKQVVFKLYRNCIKTLNYPGFSI